jgi:ADP-ribose pyrophosphatase YjhB (NUDIX family)
MIPVVRAAMVIQKDDAFLLVQEATVKVHGKWNWQQGKVEAGETPEAAAMREAKEESGYDTRIIRKLGVVLDPFSGTSELHIFLGEITGGALKISEGEILQAAWRTVAEIEAMKTELVGPWVIETIRLV